MRKKIFLIAIGAMFFIASSSLLLSENVMASLPPDEGGGNPPPPPPPPSTKVYISGYLTDKDTGKPIPYATVDVKHPNGQHYTATTSVNGWYLITLPKTSCIMTFTYHHPLYFDTHKYITGLSDKTDLNAGMWAQTILPVPDDLPIGTFIHDVSVGDIHENVQWTVKYKPYIENGIIRIKITITGKNLYGTWMQGYVGTGAAYSNEGKWSTPQNVVLTEFSAPESNIEPFSYYTDLSDVWFVFRGVVNSFTLTYYIEAIGNLDACLETDAVVIFSGHEEVITSGLDVMTKGEAECLQSYNDYIDLINTMSGICAQEYDYISMLGEVKLIYFIAKHITVNLTP